MKKARIRLEPLDGTSSVVIVDEDGTEHDITDAVSACETSRNQHGDCIATLTLPRVAVTAEVSSVRVDLVTRDALLHLGWTPPKDDVATGGNQ